MSSPRHSVLAMVLCLYALVGCTTDEGRGALRSDDTSRPEPTEDMAREASCGNGECSPWETCDSCPGDCGECGPSNVQQGCPEDVYEPNDTLAESSLVSAQLIRDLVACPSDPDYFAFDVEGRTSIEVAIPTNRDGSLLVEILGPSGLVLDSSQTDTKATANATDAGRYAARVTRTDEDGDVSYSLRLRFGESCGNGVIEGNELCDGDCPRIIEDCDDGQECTTDTLRGDPDRCQSYCEHEIVDVCGAADGCCAGGCTSLNDPDCDLDCGNGVVELGESCDGNCPASDQDCDDNDACTVDLATGNPATCDAVCNHPEITRCELNGDGCCPAGCDATTDADCSDSCGNGTVEANETCDGNDCPTSDADCDDGEACTIEYFRGDPAACTAVCVRNTITACSATSDGCCPPSCNANTDVDCVPECGNGVVEPGETCDGNCPVTCDDGDACTADTTIGDAASCDVECSSAPITTCTGGDGCCAPGCDATIDSDCAPACGNGVLESGEQCDDANTVSGDGCDSGCRTESGWDCIGTTCTEICGDGLVVGTEECDDSNADAGDGCNMICQLETGWDCSGIPTTCTTVCGDGYPRGTEECDDGNLDNGDGCTDACTAESGWECMGEPSACAPICGDGTILGAETCDDGGTIDGDGCDAACQTEPGWSCTGTPSTCAEICGDGTLVGSETCDDGNTTFDDGCDSSCSIETGWICDTTVSPTACTPDCGDGQCLRPHETDVTCAPDCDVCMNGYCDASENCQTCPDDCPECCGDGQCLPGETATSCSEECSECGDGQVTGDETCSSCSEDFDLGPISSWGTCQTSDVCDESGLQYRDVRVCENDQVVVRQESQPCAVDTDGTVVSAWTDCSGSCSEFDTDCDETGTCTSTREVCSGGVQTTETQTVSCTRNTDGTVVSDWTDCSGSCSGFSEPCGESGTCTSTREVCQNGSIQTESGSVDCYRDTDGVIITDWGAWSGCSFSSTCDESGSQTRTREVCSGGTLSTESDSQTCTRDTDGDVVSDWTDCSASCSGFVTQCDETGSCTSIREVCSGGAIQTESRTDSCTRETDGDAVSAWSDWSSCSFSSTCDETGTQSRARRECQNSLTVTVTESRGCSRDTDGDWCGVASYDYSSCNDGTCVCWDGYEPNDSKTAAAVVESPVDVCFNGGTVSATESSSTADWFVWHPEGSGLVCDVEPDIAAPAGCNLEMWVECYFGDLAGGARYDNSDGDLCSYTSGDVLCTGDNDLHAWDFRCPDQGEEYNMQIWVRVDCDGTCRTYDLDWSI